MGIQVAINLLNIHNFNYCDKHNWQKTECNIGSNKIWICDRCNHELSLGKQNSNAEQIASFKARRLSNLKLSDDLKNKQFDNFEIYEHSLKNVVDDLRNYTNLIMTGEIKSNLLLIGPTGTGKSHLATGIVKLLNEKWMLSKSIGFIPSFKLAQREMDSWNDKDICNRNIYEEFAELDFLVIDDFGFDDAGRKMEIIQKILFLRHENGKPTVITSNLLKEECFELMGDRTKSRFCGNLYKCITVKSADYRLKDFD